MIGKTFGKLTVVSNEGRLGNAKTDRSNYYKCQCVCGEFRTVRSSNLVNDQVKRCHECAKIRRRAPRGGVAQDTRLLAHNPELIYLRMAWK